MGSPALKAVLARRPRVVSLIAGRQTPRRVGSMWNTYYMITREDHFRGPKNTGLYNHRCEQIATVRRQFYYDLCIQGSGILDDGRVVNFADSCTHTCRAAPRCLNRETRICYLELDEKRYPFGMGAGVPLVPARSVAVDPRVIPLGSWIYLEELDGVTPPGGRHPHDGCVRAEDTGGGIRGNHLDIFAGSRRSWLRWERLLPTRSSFTAWLHHPRCRGRSGPRVRLPPFGTSEQG